MFRPVHHTDDTHHLHYGLELSTSVNTPQTLNNLNSHDFNNYTPISILNLYTEIN
jgi:hypothetical protein